MENGYGRERTRALLDRVARGLEEGRVLSKIYGDPEIFELEKERIFRRCYVYLAHESEIPAPGDYVLRYIAEDSFIVVRDADGRIRVFFNACRHRGMPVCRFERGNTSGFLCPYHGWSYRLTGELVGVPAEKEVYGEGFDKSAWGLQAAPRVETYDGMIFASLDPRAPSLREYLGDMAWYLDLITKRSAVGLEVVGPPHRWIVDANWKLPAENFCSDAYHTLMTHHTMVELGLAPPDPKFAMYGVHVHTENGHGLGIIGAPPHVPLPPFWGYPEEMVESLRRNYPSSNHVEVARRTNFLHGTIFPNLSILNVMIAKDHRTPPTPMLTFRVWRPLGPEQTEVWSWFLVERDAPSWFKELSYQTYVHTFGPSGVFEQDDAEVWRGITRAARGMMAEGFELNLQLGMHFSPDPQWLGPGIAYPLDYSEANERAFLQTWCRYLMDGETEREEGR